MKMDRNSSGGASAAATSGGSMPRAGHRGRWAAATLLALVVALLAGLPSSAAALPDGRAYEQVTPADKHGASPQPLGSGFQGPLGGLAQTSENGDAFTYVADLPVETEPEGNRAIEGNQTLAHRTATGWSSRDIVTPHSHGEGLSSGEAQEYRQFSPDLASAMLQPFGLPSNPLMEPPLVAGSTSEERSLYRRENQTCEVTHTGCYEAIVNSANDTGTFEGKQTPFGGQLEFQSSTPDMGHSVFVSQLPLTQPSSTTEPVGIYESDRTKPATEQLQLVSVLPGPTAEPAKEPGFGGIEIGENGQLVRGALSKDGSRAFFTGVASLSNAKGEEFVTPPRFLFMRDTTTHVTVRLDAPEEGVKEGGGLVAQENRRVHYQGASTDGSRIFFTSNVALTKESKVHPKELGEGPVNLYVCEIPTTAPVSATTTCKLHDLTAGLKGSGDVIGNVSALSEDGRAVYFVANGVPEGGKKGNCPNPTSRVEITQAERCHLYVIKLNGETWEAAPKEIATLSGGDAPNWAIAGNGELGQLTARTSPSGRYFAFMSELPLTGYDNHVINPGIKEPAPAAEEVFLYDTQAPSGAQPLTCASCNPNKNQRPMGVYDQQAGGEGFGLVVDPFSYVWKNRWLAGSIPGWTSINIHKAPYQSQYLLDNGRLYFTSSDSLVPHQFETRNETVEGTETKAGIENVYQYEQEGSGTCEAGKGACLSLISSGSSEHESGFLDATATGSDVFFLTAAQLVSTDQDTLFDVYDARECTGSSPCLTPPPPPGQPCNSESACRSGSAAAVPTFANAPSSTYSGPGNSPTTEVLGAKSSKPPPKKLTKAQKLARALVSCRKKYKHSRGKRHACERQARRAYGAKSTSHKKRK